MHMNKRSLRQRLAVSLSAASLLAAALAGSAFATNTVTAAITGGGLTASIANVTLTPSAFQSTAHAVTGTLSLSATDATDSNLGWHVTVQSSAFVYTGTATGGADIPATAFSVTSAALPIAITGQASDTTAFPVVGRHVGSLDTPVQVVSATAAYGAGSYTQALGVDLLIPAGAHVGSYAATLTVTIVSGA